MERKDGISSQQLLELLFLQKLFLTLPLQPTSTAFCQHLMRQRNEHLDCMELGEFSLIVVPQVFTFLVLVVQRLFWAIWTSFEPFGLFALCLTRNFGSLVWKLL
jgi:hypothetical protein